MNLRKDEKHDAFFNEGESTQCLTDASDRESNVNALKGKSPGFSGFVHLLIRQLADNGITSKTFSLRKDGITVARQPMIFTWFLINSHKGNPQRLDVF